MDLLTLVQLSAQGVFEDAEENPQLGGLEPPTWAESTAARTAASEAKRLKGWIDEAVEGGATLLCGGRREGNMLEATLLEHVEEQDIVAFTGSAATGQKLKSAPSILQHSVKEKERLCYRL